jgi:DNA adenine methylase
MKPIFPWPGGKSWATQHVLPMIKPHECYCEPFAGGLAVLLSKEISRLEVVNDLNSSLVNFYRCVRYHADELIREIQWTLNSREEFQDYKKQPGLTDIQRAARWFCIQTVSFGGGGDSYAVTRKSGGGANKSRHLLQNKIALLGDRLDKVNVEHLDWQYCIKLYDSSETFFFLDPPYLGGNIKNYEAWTIQDLKQMRIILDSLSAEWLLTINDCPEAREVFDGLRIKPLKRWRGIANTKGNKTEYNELLISPA